MMLFADRVDAGRQLAARLTDLRGPAVVVLGLPRGGVPVAAEVATALDAPLDVVIVRKLGLPFRRELAMGAIGEGGVRVLDLGIIDSFGITDAEIAEVELTEQNELERRAQTYRLGRARLHLNGRVVIVVDDGAATGATAMAALQVVRAHGAARVILALPVAPPSAVDELRSRADGVVCLAQPDDLQSIGRFYGDFSATSDAEVITLLENSKDAGEVKRPHTEEHHG